MNPTKILLADDHRIIINGLRAMLEEESDLSVIGEVTNGQEAVDFIKNYPDTDVVLMDIRMPVKNGIEATREILETNPNVHIMALTMFEDDEFISGIVKAGAIGYVLKHTSKNELLMAIRRIAKGEAYFGFEVMKSVLTRLVGQAEATQAFASVTGFNTNTDANNSIDVTDREKEILFMIASQMTNQEIAERLFISPRTVHSHRRNLMQKIGVKNTAGLVRYAMEHKILPNSE